MVFEHTHTCAPYTALTTTHNAILNNVIQYNALYCTLAAILYIYIYVCVCVNCIS